MEVFEAKFGSETIHPWEPLNIVPIGDIQFAGKNGPTDLKRLARHIQWARDNNAWYIGMGDYVDFASPSNRTRLKNADLYDTASLIIDEAAKSLEDEVIDVLSPTKGRWIGLCEGHHYMQHLDGTTTGQRVAAALGTTYGGDSMMIRVTFRDDQGHSVVTKLFVHHGHGGTSTLAGPIARLERFMAYTTAQVAFIGHHHRIMIIPFDQLDMTDRGKPYLFHTTRVIVLTGYFMKGWMQGNNVGGRPSGSYVEQKLLGPVTLGSPMVTLVPERERSDDGSTYRVAVHGQI